MVGPCAPRTGPAGHLLLLTLLLVVSGFAGCTAPDPGGAGPSGGEEPTEDEQDEGDDLLDPAAETLPQDVEPGVQQITDRLLDEGGALGYVYDQQTHRLLEGVQVVAQCIVDGIDLPVGSQVVETGNGGRFTLSAGGLLAGCEEVSYQALKEGHTMVKDVASPALAAGEQYLVLIAMEPV